MKSRTKIERKKKATAELSPAILATSFEEFASSKEPAPPSVGHSFSNLPTLQPQAKLSVSQPGDRYEKDVTPIAQAGLQSSGQPLDAETRAFMEPRFGHDFSKVRVHTDALAEKSAA